jgi:acyl-CoA thioester hydrolase
MSGPRWDLPDPFIHRLRAQAADLDAYNHVNNAVYVRWLDECAWAHSTALNLPPEACLTTRRGMAVWRTQLNYLAAAYEGDELELGTWIVWSDRKLRCDRRFQLMRRSDGRTLLRALVHYVCIDLDSGRPQRMPEDYARAYGPLDSVVAAIAAESTPFLPGVEPHG